jgi:PKD repeat protein
MKKIILILLTTLISIFGFSQSITPQLQSRPNANMVFLVDFDGATVTNYWSAVYNGGKPIVTAPSNMNAAQRLEIYQIIANTFAIFDINVTTIKSVYDSYPWNKKSRLMSTPTNFMGAGGVAILSALSIGSPTYEYCWAFEGSLQANPKFIAQAGAHELGHTANLGHQGMYNTSGVKTADYHFGKGTGELSWGPIMGAPYSANVNQWVIGPSALPRIPTFTYPPGSTFAGTTITCHQNDWLMFLLKRLSAVEGGEFSTGGHPTSGIRLLPDDIGNTIATSKTLNMVNGVSADSGLINISLSPANATTYITGLRPTDPRVVLDEDVFKFTVAQTSNVNIKCRPWSQDILTNKNAMLDTRIVLRNASGGIIAVDSNLARLNSEINLSNVAQGDYFITVGASGNSQLTDIGYGNGYNQNTRFHSVGKYYLNVNVSGSSSIPTANFIASPKVCVNAQTQLSNTSVGGTSFSWNFGSGASPATSTAINPTVRWSSAGTKTITLTATNSSGTNTISKTLTVFNPPTPNILATYNGISCPEGSSCPANCVGTPITLTAQPSGDNAAPYTYMWIGQGEANSAKTQTVTVSNPQLPGGPSTGYMVNCIMTNSAGCSAEGYKFIPLTERPNATISGPTTISAGQTITLSVPNVSGNTYSWSTGANTSSINVTLAGTYRVTVSRGNCSSTGSLVVNGSNCTVTPSVSGVSSLCPNQSGTLTASATGSSPFTFAWSTGSTAQTITINSAGSYTVTVTGNGGCTATSTRNVTLSPSATVSISGTNSICEGGFTTLTASGANTYSWSTGAATPSITVNPTVTTTYTVTGVNSSGCSGIASRIVTVFPNTPATIDGVNSVCDGNSALFTASNGASYSWNTGATTASITINQANTYTVVITSANGCTSTASKTLSIDLLPNVTSSSNSPLCPGQTLNLQASPNGLVSYTWTGPNGFTSSLQNPTLSNIQPNGSGLYLVTGVDSKGCSSTISTAVLVNNTVGSLSITSNSPVCINSTLQIVASGGSNYSWVGPNNYVGVGSTVTINNVSENNSGTYVVTSSSTCGSIKDSIQVVIDAPIIATYNVTACKSSETSNFTASGVSTFSFSPTTNVDPSSGTIAEDIEAIQSLFSLSTTPRTYILTTTSVSGCTKLDTIYTQRIVPPSIGSVLGLTSTSATLSWNNTGGEEYQVRYRRKGATNWVLLQPIKVDNIQITNFTSNTNYEWQVRSKCNCESWSAFSKLFNFSTP